ncbi:MAG: hypothetical protein JWO58_335 [Chitinophagaceae bacterium]|nr:hypothetical protein [Chitinophagaceae bacterium]
MKTHSKSFLILTTFVVATLFSHALRANVSVPGTWSNISPIPSIPNTISYSGTDFTNPILVTLTSYQGWSSFTFTTNGTGTAGTIDCSTNLQIGFATDLQDKQMLVTLTDNAGKSTSMDLTALLLMPNYATVTTSTPTENYSINFNQVTKATGIALNLIRKINFTIYDHKTGSQAGTTSPTFTNGHVLIYLQPGTGAATTSTILNPSQGQEWGMESNGYMYNTNGNGIVVGSPTANNVTSLLSYPYYNFIVNGRTNFIGNDNAIGIWSANVPTSGFRHYLGITNATFPGSSPAVEYSMINAYEYNSGTGTGNQKHLILNNFQSAVGVADGNIGIGYHTTAPLEKLSVNGNIRCKKLIVTTSNFADYVFDENYKLRSLEEVKQFVEKENHLPGIPSEKEVVTKGMDVNELLLLHMEKIEELTLYIIQQQAQIEKLTNKVEQLTK